MCDEYEKYPKSVFDKINSSEFDNLYLCHNKFIFKKIKVDKSKNKNNSKINNFESCCKNKTIIPYLYTRTVTCAESYVDKEEIEYSPASRLLIGTGGESPYNNILLMTLHHTYGLPYIPATAIKGCLHHYYEQELKEKSETVSSEIEKLFGSSNNDEPNSKGCLVFFDTFPVNYTLEFDALTPHNPGYYGNKGENAPSDSDRKIPLMIPCLSKDSKFKIYLACTDGDVWEKHKITIIDNLKKALKEYGLGGKTSYGYGLSK